MLWMVIAFGLQFVLLFYLVFWSAFTKQLVWIFLLISIISGIAIITRKENSMYRLTWMFVQVVAPLFGGVLYILFANKKIGSLSEKNVLKFRSRIEDETNFISTVNRGELETVEPFFLRQVKYIENSTGFSAYEDTDIAYFTPGDDFFPDLMKHLKKAKKFIFIEYFIIEDGKWWNRILDILKEKVREGLDVRVVFDDMGSINVLPVNYEKTLQSFGIKAISFNKIKLYVNPRLNFRTHRKIFVIDGNIAYTGGVNLADEYANDKIKFGYWKDDAVRLHGSAVWNFTLMFLRNWDCLTEDHDTLDLFVPTEKGISDGLVQPFDDSPVDKVNMTEECYLQIINSAEKYVWITTPYLILDETFEKALIMASRSGVDVRIITPHHPDKKTVFEVTRSNYESLLKNGVKIYEFTPGFIHSKNFICDDVTGAIGTANLDYRSFYLHFELCVLFHKSSIVGEMKDNFLKTMELSEEIHEGDEKKLKLSRRIVRNALRIMAPLF